MVIFTWKEWGYFYPNDAKKGWDVKFQKLSFERPF